MSTMIILQPDEAEKVTGVSPLAPWAALEPVPLKDGTYMLPEDVIDDPAHADVADFLKDLPTIDSSKVDQYDPATDTVQEKAEYAAAKLDYAEVGVRKDEIGDGRR